jgi:hypothetical protein
MSYTEEGVSRVESGDLMSGTMPDRQFGVGASATGPGLLAAIVDALSSPTTLRRRPRLGGTDTAMRSHRRSRPDLQLLVNDRQLK